MGSSPLDESTIVRRARSARDGLERAVAGSRVRTAVASVADRTARLVAASSLAAGARALAAATRASRVYRWFTSDPDPDVVEIDLREVRTVAPFVVALGRARRGLGRAWDGSAPQRAIAGLDAALRSSAFVQSRPVSSGIEIAAALLEPPEPPTRTDEGVDSTTRIEKGDDADE